MIVGRSPDETPKSMLATRRLAPSERGIPSTAPETESASGLLMGALSEATDTREGGRLVQLKPVNEFLFRGQPTAPFLYAIIDNLLEGENP